MRPLLSITVVTALLRLTAVPAAAAPLAAADPPLATDDAALVAAVADDEPRWSTMPDLAWWSEPPPAPVPVPAERRTPSAAERLGWGGTAPDPRLYAVLGAVLVGAALVLRRRR